MNFNFENNLEIYGNHEDLNNFFIDNSSDKTILTFRKVIPDDADNIYLLEGGMYEGDDLYYRFLTLGSSALEWLDGVAKRYINLEFCMVYQNMESGESGEIIYKRGKLYHNCRYNCDDEVMENEIITI